MKRDKIIYWVATGLASLGFLSSGLMYLLNPEITVQFKGLGYPEYFVLILGIAKITGAVGIINPWFHSVREWAYAGYTFTLIGAALTHIATGTPFIASIIFLVIVFISYYFHSKVKVGVAKTQFAI